MQDNKNEAYYDEDEYIDVRAVLHNYSRIFFKRWYVLIILCVVLCGGLIGYKYVTSANHNYMASAIYSFERGSDVYSNSNVAARLATGISTITNTSDFRNDINEELGQTVSGYAFAGTATSSSNLVTVTVYSSNKKLANKLIKAFTKVYPDWVNKSVGSCTFVQESVTYSTGMQPRDWSVLKMLLLGIMGGCFLWVCYATVCILFLKTVHDDYDMKQITGVTCLGILPDVENRDKKEEVNLLMTERHLDSAYRQSFRALRQQVDKLYEAGNKVFMVTSTDAAEGKSLITLNLAYSLMRRKKKVTVIDTDFYNQGISSILHVNVRHAGTTLMDYLEDTTKEITQPQDVEGISVLFAGSAEGREFNYLNEKRLQEIISKLQETSDVILIDTAPVNRVGDALLFSEVADCALYVVRCEYTQTREIISGMEPLYRNHKLAGYILNRVKMGKSDNNSYYGYGYGRGYGNYAHYNTYRSYGDEENMQDWED